MVSGKLRIGGSWTGVLELEFDECTVSVLRQQVANRSNCENPQSIKLICAGKVLKDDDGGMLTLTQMGIKNNAKILATKLTDTNDRNIREEFLAEEERCKRLSRIKAAATSLAQRHADGSLPVEDFNLELENQSGEKVQLGSETDQRAIMMGLMLHTNGKALIRRLQYRNALEVLTMGEEAFSLCDPKLIEMVDNVSILQIDMVWCYFMLRDISWLSDAGIRLAKAREGIERAHGKESARLRILHGGCYPELALHLRMELLEGVVAYHSGQLQKSNDSLTSAQARYLQLQISDDTLSLLMSMGYGERESKRALRMNSMDAERAVDFLIEEKAKKAQKRADDLKRQKEIMEQKQYGTTPLKKAVNIGKLNELVSIGFEKDLAAEALRRNENDTQKALDDLTNPETNTTLQDQIISRKTKRLRHATASAVEHLVSMGFPRLSVEEAVRRVGNEEAAVNHLLAHAEGASSSPSSASASSVPIPNVGSSSTGHRSNLDVGPSAREGDSSSFTVDGNDTEKRDMEMEGELTVELQNTDAYSDYDIEVTKEGEAIAEYLALLRISEKQK